MQAQSSEGPDRWMSGPPQKWKAVQLNMDKGGGPIMLFSADDLAEKNNVASKYPEVVKKFKKILSHFFY